MARLLRRAAQCFALTLALSAFAVVLVSTLPSAAMDESESEREHEVAGPTECDVHRPLPHAVVTFRAWRIPPRHGVDPSLVLRPRSVTFRIDRPPPA